MASDVSVLVNLLQLTLCTVFQVFLVLGAEHGPNNAADEGVWGCSIDGRRDDIKASVVERSFDCIG